ncbi:unnamed protein product [Miscanthus lutarioriparius]|uniref:Uncharacterized protein n=1 Tax=Miscanthus lutarioriparius TaxID=422564 RepID=A0A811QJ24_9POAL|nr:unnamed protein product [Miscanthus lutarioriparius]
MERSVFGGGGVAQSDSVSASAIVAQTVKGSHVLKIDGYSRVNASAGSGKFISSGEFVVGGITWDIRYYPNGCTPKTSGWIGIVLHLKHNHATGVEASYAFSLLDGAGEPVPSYSYGKGTARTFKCADTGFGCRRFIMRKALEGSAYLKDDSFSVRCDVTVSTTAVRIPRSVAVPPPDMHQHIGRLLESQVGTDVTFQVGEETFAAHRLVLAARSPVFMAQLFGPMKERSTGHVRIDDMDPRVFRAMLHFIYTDSLPDMDSGDDARAMAQHLLVAADRYDMERLKLTCEDRLCDYINTGTAATTLVLAELHGSRGLKEACFEFLKSPGNLKATMDCDEFQHLTNSCPSLLSELLANVAP